MATGTNYSLDSKNAPGVFHTNKFTDAATAVTNRLLNDNHSRYHVFFSDEEKEKVLMHNHMPHQALTAWSLGADASVLAYNHAVNSAYQRIQPDLAREEVLKLAKAFEDPKTFTAHLGKINGAEYRAYLLFFERQIDELGLIPFLNKWLFADNSTARDLLYRMFSGFIHPFIHLGFGVEFRQPALVAEAFAMATAHHDDFIPAAYVKMESLERSVPSRTAIEILDECQTDKVRSWVAFEAFDKLEDILEKGGQEFLNLLLAFQVDENNLYQKALEVCDAASYSTIAAQRKEKATRIDFFTMHTNNCNSFVLEFLHMEGISPKAKATIIEAFGRTVIWTYAAMRSPQLDLPLLRSRKTTHNDWQYAFDKSIAFPDDGHAVKVVRALAALAQELERAPAEVKKTLKLSVEDCKLGANATVDSLHSVGVKAGYFDDESWIRCAGWEQAWDEVPAYGQTNWRQQKRTYPMPEPPIEFQHRSMPVAPLYAY